MKMKPSIRRFRLSDWPVKIFGILLIVTLLAGLMPQQISATSQTKTKCTPTYQVKRGDTLKKIGDRFGFAPNQIVYLNNWVLPYTIYVGQNICIPLKVDSSAPKIDNKYVNIPAAYFTAGRSGADIMVYTYTYPKTTVLVKVRDASNSAKNFYDVGTINIAAVGNGKTSRFKLPAQLQNAKQLQVCLKDRNTSYLQCVYPRSGS
jgi:LysM repeat protein